MSDAAVTGGIAGALPPVGGNWQAVFQAPARARLEALLPSWLHPRRWFAGKSRSIAAVTIAHAVPLGGAGAGAVMAILRVAFAGGGTEHYTLPLTFIQGEDAEVLRARRPHLEVAPLVAGGVEGALVDAVGDERALRTLLALVEQSAVVEGDGATLRFRHLGDAAAGGDVTPRLVDAEQTNTSVVFGEAGILKLRRRLDAGTSPDLEMGEFLTRAGFAHAPPVTGAIEIVRGGVPSTLAIMHRFVRNQGDAWSFFLAAIDRFLMRFLDEPHDPSTDETDDNDDNDDTGARLRRLGTRVAEMHIALASRSDLPAFAPEPLSHADRAAIAEAARRSLQSALQKLAARHPHLPTDARAGVSLLLERHADLSAAIARFVALTDETGAVKMRVHGDLHLGQVLVTDDDFILIDFEGEPARTLEERKAKRSPLVDVAGMLRSLHYAAVTAGRAAESRTTNIAAASRSRADQWHRSAIGSFLDGYNSAARDAPFLPRDPAARATVLDFYLLEKCIYEVHYEIDNRPDWVAIPVAGLVELLGEKPR